MKYLLLGVFAATAFLAACEDPAANKTKAIVTNSTNTAANTRTTGDSNKTAALTAKGDALALNPDNSKIEFTGSKITGKHDGGFKQFSGTIDLVNGKAEESAVWVDIDMTTVFTDADGLTEHLKKADFFEVAKYPKASFISTSITADPAKGPGSYNVTGDLELHGVTKSITFPATINLGEKDVVVNAEFSINRKDFDIVYAGQADDLIRDFVAIRLDLNAPRK